MARRELSILVDHSNIDQRLSGKSFREVAEKLLADKQVSSRLGDIDQVDFRLYGGWFDETTLTPLAERVQTEVYRDFPYVLKGAPRLTRVTAELARSLICEPTVALRHTRRLRAHVQGLTLDRSKSAGCFHGDQSGGCAVADAFNIVMGSTCPVQGCQARPSNLVRRQEQKLVDTLMTADLLFLAFRLCVRSVVLVSADDDFWPAIRAATAFGCEVLHIFPKIDRVPNADYLTNMPKSYRFARLEL